MPTESNILICSVNWLGDCIMSMPAISEFKRCFPDRALAVLTKPKLVPIWNIFKFVDDILILKSGRGGIRESVRSVEAGRYRKAFVLPNSFRSGLIPYLAGIPTRIGVPGHFRRWMLTNSIMPELRSGQGHQAYEYFSIMGVDPENLQPPSLEIDLGSKTLSRGKLLAAARDMGMRVDAGDSWIAMVPGAARGPSKRWPAAHYVQLGRKLLASRRSSIVLMGTAEEGVLCAHIANEIGRGAVNMAGSTSLSEFASMLSLCELAVANDSGGMHLAAAVGVPTVGIFGATDHAKTGPLGDWATVVCAHGVLKSRDIARESTKASQAMLQIQAERVFESAMRLLEAREEELASHDGN